MLPQLDSPRSSLPLQLVLRDSHVVDAQRCWGSPARGGRNDPTAGRLPEKRAAISRHVQERTGEARRGRPLVGSKPRLGSDYLVCFECARSHVARASLDTAPPATPRINASWSSTAAATSWPFRRRNTAMAAWPARLFPSTKGCPWMIACASRSLASGSSTPAEASGQRSFTNTDLEHHPQSVDTR